MTYQFFFRLNRQEGWSAILLVVGLLAYSVTLIVGIPDALVSLLSSDDSTIPYFASILLLYFAFRLSGYLGRLVGFSVALWLFAAQLSSLWRSAASPSFMVLSGLLPVSDANNYYMSVQRLLEGGNLSVDASGRPLSHGLLVAVLGLTQQNLQLTLAILSLVTAVACYLLAWEVRRSHGPLAGALVFSTNFFFDRAFLGTTMTENLGLTLGALGTAALWRGAVNRRARPCLFGIFLLALALNARAGAFFILPAIIIWGTWLFRGNARISFGFLLTGFSAVLLAFLINSLVFKVIGRPGTMMNANFSYVFYGLTVGGNWQTVRTDHPEIMMLEEAKQAQRIYQLAFAAFRAHPLTLVSSMIRAWQQFLFSNFLFSFFRSTSASLIAQLLSLISLLACLRQRSSSIASLLLLGAIGIIASVPFAPPWDGGIRIYAATIPWLSLYPSLGLLWICRKFDQQILAPISETVKFSKVLEAIGIGLTLLLLLGPITTKALSHRPQFLEIACPKNLETVYFRNSRGSSIHLLDESSSQPTKVPAIRWQDFQTGLTQFQRKYGSVEGIPDSIQKLSQLTPGQSIFAKINLKDYESMWLVIDSAKIPAERRIVGACGRFQKLRHMAPLFYAESLQLVPDKPSDL